MSYSEPVVSAPHWATALFDDLCDGRPCLVVDRGDRCSAQVPDVGLGVHEVEVDVVRSRCGELEGEVITFSPQLVVVAPLGARGVADALGAAVGVPVRRYVHAGLCGGAAAGLRDVERGCGACGRVVPALGERDAVLLCGGGVGVGYGLGSCLVGWLLGGLAGDKRGASSGLLQ